MAAGAFSNSFRTTGSPGMVKVPSCPLLATVDKGGPPARMAAWSTAVYSVSPQASTTPSLYACYKLRIPEYHIPTILRVDGYRFFFYSL